MMITIRQKFCGLCVLFILFVMGCAPAVTEEGSVKVIASDIETITPKEKSCHYKIVPNTHNYKIFISARGQSTRFCDDGKAEVSAQFAKIVSEKLSSIDEGVIEMRWNTSTLNALRNELVSLSAQNSGWRKYTSPENYTEENELDNINAYHDIMTTMFLGSKFYASLEEAFSPYKLGLSLKEIEIVGYYSFDRNEDDCQRLMSDDTCQYLEANDIDELAVIRNVMISVNVSEAKL